MLTSPAATPAKETDDQIRARLIAAARELAPRIAARAAADEKARRISDDTIREAGEAGFFRIMVPKSMGGYELDWETVCRVIVEAGRYDGSSAWQLGFFIMHNWLWLGLSEQAQEEVYGPKGYSTGPVMLAPAVKARKVDGGFVLNGRSRWATGINHAEWVFVSTMVEGEEKLGFRDFMIPAGEVIVHENWDVAGMCATGSHDVEYPDLFVPAHRSANLTAAFSGENPDILLHKGPKYRIPRFTSMIFGSSSPLVALAHGAVETFRKKVEGYTSPVTGGRTIDNIPAVNRLAKAQIRLDAAEQYLYSIARRMLEWNTEAPLTQLQRVQIRAGVVHVTNEAREIVQSVAATSGSGAYTLDQPMQRYLRDVSMMATHFYHDQDTGYEPLGRVMVGLDPNTRLA
ncbi:acyl-CoA dehydrogenase family protein [Phenylobacterium sp.]|uniref:acyl-CoA dehydrogenase family protein n=1 Tax=Phenylobacterium sp. TaxID=1871053 RepID=UPI0025F8714E|nr:acyl-CoA dehydrogenase family protein [Phenylobacterium sp.]